MCQFTTFYTYTYVFSICCHGAPRRVAPFGNLRINSCLRLPEAFRSLPRPSSSLHAKVSTLRSYILDQNLVYSLKSNSSIYINIKTYYNIFELLLPNLPL